MKNKTLRVNEIFYSIQGEGIRAGQPTIFIRLNGCNKTCSFCDTDHSQFQEMNLLDILKKCKSQNTNVKWITWTGGEPMLQITTEIVDFFKKEGYCQAIESNGSMSIPDNIDYIVVSPKDIDLAEQKRVDEIRLLYPLTHCFNIFVPGLYENASVCISPIFYDEDTYKTSKNIKEAVEFVLQNPKFYLSVQIHKLIHIR